MVVVLGSRNERGNHADDAQNGNERTQVAANVEVENAGRVFLAHSLNPTRRQRKRYQQIGDLGVGR